MGDGDKLRAEIEQGAGGLGEIGDRNTMGYGGGGGGTGIIRDVTIGGNGCHREKR